MKCPKCGFVNSENTEECLKCGIVLKKLNAINSPRPKSIKKKTTLEDHYGKRAGEAKRFIYFCCIGGALIIFLNFKIISNEGWDFSWFNLILFLSGCGLFLVAVMTWTGANINFKGPKFTKEKLVDQPASHGD